MNLLAFTPAVEWEPPGIIFLKLLTVMFLVLLNGFFVASEFAIVKVRGTQLDAMVDRGEKRARFARHVTVHLDAYLSATQLGITLASLALGWIGEPFLAHMIEPFFVRAGITSNAIIEGSAFALAFAAITFLHIVLGELAPKSLAIRKSVQTTLWVARPLGLFHSVFKPAIWVLNGAANWILRHVMGLDPVAESELAHSEEELRLIVAESRKSADGAPLDRDIMLKAMDLRHRTVRDVMTPRGSVVFLDAEDGYAENLALAKSSLHTRFPLCSGHLDEAVGLIHIKDLLTLAGEAQPDLMKIKRELMAVPEMMSLPRLLALFRAKHAHMALVADEFGGSVGIVTLDDAIEELVGEIQDEFDSEQPAFRRVNEDEFIASGALSLHELRDQCGLDLENEDVSTLGGYITAELGHLPQKGEHVIIEGYKATVMQSDGRRVGDVHFQRVTGGDQ